MSLALTNRHSLLRDRAKMLAQARAFFEKRDLLEVDVPILTPYPSIDAYIDLIEAHVMGERAFLHTSPEYGMKRLLSEGIGDCYQLSHVFRQGERGPSHNPEFVLVEWYRLDFSFEAMIEETLDFIRLFLEGAEGEFERLSYKEAFETYVGGYPQALEERDRLFAFEIEPQLNQSVIYDFPPEQAALSQIGKHGLAERFEVFYQGVELANGYHELGDPVEQKRRFEQANQVRLALGKEAYPVDSLFLAALEEGFPDCCGVAVGFDRLMMLRHGVDQIDAILPFAWEKAL